MPNRHIIDFRKTFGEDATLEGVDPKMELINRDDRNGPQQHAKDKNGVPKWIITISYKDMSFMNPKYEHVAITVTSPTKPLDGAPRGTPVIGEDVELGIMAREKSGFTTFYSATSIRPIQQPRMMPNQPGIPPTRGASGQ